MTPPSLGDIGRAGAVRALKTVGATFTVRYNFTTQVRRACGCGSVAVGGCCVSEGVYLSVCEWVYGSRHGSVAPFHTHTSTITNKHDDNQPNKQINKRSGVCPGPQPAGGLGGLAGGGVRVDGGAVRRRKNTYIHMYAGMRGRRGNVDLCVVCVYDHTL